MRMARKQKSTVMIGKLILFCFGCEKPATP